MRDLALAHRRIAAEQPKDASAKFRGRGWLRVSEPPPVVARSTNNGARLRALADKFVERRKPMATAGQKRKVSRVMKEHKRGTLKSGSGRKVKSRKQAVAIAMSESGQSRKPKKKTTSRAGTARKKSTAKRKSR
jgi:hypothetical protein